MQEVRVDEHNDPSFQTLLSMNPLCELEKFYILTKQLQTVRFSVCSFRSF